MLNFIGGIWLKDSLRSDMWAFCSKTSSFREGSSPDNFHQSLDEM